MPFVNGRLVSNAEAAAPIDLNLPEVRSALEAGKQPGDASERASAGVLGDLFDFLARPSRASATAAKYALDKDPRTSLLQGIGEGLSGKAKYSYSDVLKDQGIGGRPGAILGFAGDIFLDPLTYTGVGLTKGISKELAEITAMKTLGAESAEKVAAEVTRLQAANPTRLYGKFLGKKVTPGVGVPGTGPIGSKIVEVAVGKEGDRRLLLRSFSNKAEKPFGLNEIERIAEGGNAGNFGQYSRMIDEMFDKNLTDQEQELLSEAIDNGHSLQGVGLQLKNGDTSPVSKLGMTKVAHPDGFTDLEQYRTAMIRLQDNMYDSEVSFGIRNDKDRQENYIMKRFRNPPKEMMPSASNRNPKVKSKNYSFAEAKANGWDPVMKASELLKLRANQHFRDMGHAQYFDQVMANFGVQEAGQNAKVLKDKGWRNVKEALPSIPLHERWSGVYLPESIIRSLEQTRKIFNDPTVADEWLKHYDKVLGMWKFLNTGPMPGYHIRNTITDTMMNTADGVWSTKPYQQAARILKGRDNFAASQFHDMTGLGTAIPEWGGHIEVAPGYRFTLREIYETYISSGAKTGWIETEITQAANETQRKALAAFKDKRYQNARDVKDWIGKTADTREDFFRLAHYIDSLGKNLRKKGVNNLTEASELASKAVRKYNIDYGNLSTFEKKAMRRVIPFYSFMRQNLPLQVEMLFTKPGVMAAYSKGTDLAQGLLGTTDGTGEYLVPDWIRESLPVRLASAKKSDNQITNLLKKLGGARPEGEAVYMPMISGGLTPLQDLENIASPLAAAAKAGSPIAGIQDAAKTLVNQSTPALKLPVEVATGRNLFTGAELDTSPAGWAKWTANQFGIARQASKIGDSQALLPALASSGLGVPVRTATLERQAGEFRRREDTIRQEMKRIKMAQPEYQTAATEILARVDLTEEQKENLLEALLGKTVTPETERMNLQLKAMKAMSQPS